MDSIECPICNTKVSKEKIEKHVDNCLKYSKEKPATRRASMSPSNLEGFFLKKSKRKRPTSPTEDATKKQCVDNCVNNNNHDSDTTVIPDSPPPPLPSIDTESCEVDAVKISSPPSSQPSKGSFQNTLFKWSKMSGATSSSSSAEEKQGIIVVDKMKEENKSISELNIQLQTATQELMKMTKKDKNKGKAAQHKSQQKIQLGKTPLANQMRPTDFDHYFGQEAVSSSKVLRDLFCNKIIPSLLLWGPPGCGKVEIIL